jgi:hypothetical protein
MRTELIKQIHDSTLYGAIIECGCAATIANTLMEVAGASKTIAYSYQPYAIDEQKRMYKNSSSYKRVSLPFIRDVLRIEQKRMLELSNTNFVMAASFQLAAEPFILTHGWIGFRQGEFEIFYHVSIPFHTERVYQLRVIADCAIQILAHFAETIPRTEITSPYIDNIVMSQSDGSYKQQTEELLKQLINIEPDPIQPDNFVVFHPDPKQFLRFEDLVRNKKGLILYKGSFNPYHQGHAEVMEITRKFFPEYASAYFVSLERFDKSVYTIDQIKQIIKQLHEAGEVVVVCREPAFMANIICIRRRWQLPLVFPAGSDTINRFAQASLSFIEKDAPNRDAKILDYAKQLKEGIFNNSSFTVFPRKDSMINRDALLLSELWFVVADYEDTGISSTQIREEKMKGLI